ncbi:hypothetical protein EYF80_000299 [Liparis tanakae]|uniref:Uncharacterized protein n=1 Tax=Liparis tanakae TaxID=230148 RepID=A0A4Z2JHB6_9TELE|nr:hypothetical protein EYF80_000299 [Liparis tanakae]
MVHIPMPYTSLMCTVLFDIVDENSCPEQMICDDEVSTVSGTPVEPSHRLMKLMGRLVGEVEGGVKRQHDPTGGREMIAFEKRRQRD